MILHERFSGASNEKQMWCIPESFFSSKKLETLPPRPAQPVLYFTPDNQKSFDPYAVIKMLSQLELIYESTRMCLEASNQKFERRVLHRDVFVCEWLGHQGSLSKDYETEFMAFVCVE